MKLLLACLLVCAAGWTARAVVFGRVVVTNLQCLPSLAVDLSSNIEALATNTARSYYYNPQLSTLATNTGMWTWPVQLSCVGEATNADEQVTLIAPDKILSQVHIVGMVSQWLQFKDTNGVPFYTYVTNWAHVYGDEAVGFISPAAPASIVPAWIMTPDFTNFLADHTILGLPCVWLHKNAGAMQLEYVYSSYETIIPEPYFDGGEVTLQTNGVPPFGNGTWGTGGDSSSPAFFFWGNQPVVFTSATSGGSIQFPQTMTGPMVSDPINFGAMSTLGFTNGCRLLTFSGYRRY